MRKIHFFAPLAILITATSCTTVKPLKEPQRIIIDGNYTNAPTRIVFPETVGEFIRSEIVQYVADEIDVGISYNCQSLVAPIRMTVYVYPAPKLLSFGSPESVIAEARENLFNDHFVKCAKEIKMAHPEATFISATNFNIAQNGIIYTGQKATFSLNMRVPLGTELALSSIYLIQIDNNLVKYRVSYPKESEQELEPVVQNFMQSLTLSNKKDSKRKK